MKLLKYGHIKVGSPCLGCSDGENTDHWAMIFNRIRIGISTCSTKGCYNSKFSLIILVKK